MEGWPERAEIITVVKRSKPDGYEPVE